MPKRNRDRLRRALALAGALVAGAAACEAAAGLDAQTTAGITISSPGKTGRLAPASVAELKLGLDAMSSGDVVGARAVRDSLPAASLDRHILTWAIALRGGRTVPSTDIAAAARALPGWPGMDALRRNSERALLREDPAPDAVISAFGATQPQTADGAIVLARAHVAKGDADAARRALAPIWRTETLAPEEEIAILKEFGQIIPAADHRQRMERMLYADRVTAAQRVAKLAGAEALFTAWAAVAKGDKTAAKKLDAVPAVQRSAGYRFAQARDLRRAGRYADAAALLIAAPKDRAELVDADAWWKERRVLARELLDEGEAGLAYRVAATHAAESRVNQADAEFHAGWIALRKLGDAAGAARHFARIAEVAEGPISLSRAYYWLGRTAEAGGPGNASDDYRRASAYGTTFYGQLAAARIGASTINVASPVPSAADRAAFAGREAVAAIRRLEAAGYPSLADTLYRDLAAQLASAGELALLAAMAENRGNHYLALKLAKIAAARGLAIGALSHPIGVIPDSADISGSGKALAYAIARQESEFNVSAVSSAGARGLLQLLPDTARDVARRAGLIYSPERLVTDAGYNATLGAAFLGEQLGRFDGSYILTFAGYNAGPRRAAEWIKRYGDPRGKDIDTVVDWIERIPFPETRSYVQRVMENYQVYKMRLTGKVDIEHDLIHGR
jgi:soluble lytic murein transglycosylase